MSLRLRLISVLVLVSVPLVVALTWARGALEQRAEIDSMQRFIAGRMVDGRAICEADPARFPPPPRPGPPRGEPGSSDGQREREPLPEGPPIELFAYSGAFESANPRAPRFPDGLRRALEGGRDRADERALRAGRPEIRVAQRMDWEQGPCAIVLASRPVGGSRWLTRGQWLTAVSLPLVLAAVVFLAAGPIVRRVRRLTAEVRRSALAGYASPVTVTGKDEISQLALEFNAAAAEVNHQLRAVERRESSLREFVSNSTHDMMIPMTVLQGHLSALRSAAPAGDPQVLQDAMQEVQYMSSLLQNLGASAKLEAGEPELDFGDVELNALVARVAARHAPVAHQRGMELDFAVPEQPVLVRGDVTLLEQAVSNLVHNAVRHGADAGHVALILESRAADSWSLRVIDDGPGIDAQLVEQLATRHARGDGARTRHPEGQGLGLHIAHEVARRHGFTLTLRRSEHGGLEAELSGGAAPGTHPAHPQ